jgi:PEGA domain
MNRALSLSCVALVAICLTGSAAFADKPKVAILGVEVVDNGGGIDKASTDFAHDLTSALRDRPQAANGGPFTLAPNSKKELIDEKLLKSCTSDTDYPCMATIGADIDKDHGGTQFLIYGNLEKRTQAGKKGYLVNLRILNVASKQSEQTWTQFIPQDETKSAEKWAKAAYQKLIPSTGNTGGLVIKVDNEGIDKGTVIIDGSPAGSLRSGQFKASNLAEGKHRVEIEVGGFKRFSREVTVVAGETHPESFSLESECTGPGCTKPPPCDPSVDPKCGQEGTVSTGNNRGWKIAAGVSGAAMIGTGVGLYVYFSKLRETGPEFVLDSNGMLKDGVAKPTNGFLAYGGYCQRGPNGLLPNYIGTDGQPHQTPSACGALNSAGNGDKWQKGSLIFLGGLALSTAFTGYFVYKGFISKTERPPAGGTTGRRSKPPRNLVVTPVISPDGGGATLRLDW